MDPVPAHTHFIFATFLDAIDIAHEHLEQHPFAATILFQGVLLWALNRQDVRSAL
ncbi:hypothetical protein AAP_03346 [Ascosphaera apis ARSEF 7405]|uniref:Uncharacterized protein n=1 Tax=Ascosphaera apis ARSEF 7405 TaxID=392613 RepID=A0A166NQ78_9EURO|nr:hypothetical protein AAP_03346 [Ascosphaera apis ARSEF 7405]